MQEGSNYTFVSNQMYIMLGNIDVTIEPGEGIEMRFLSAGNSGNGGSTKYVYESETSGGNYQLLATMGNGSALSVIIRKGFYYKYRYEKGSGTACVENIYLYDGLLSISASNYKNYDYTIVTTSIDKGTWLFVWIGGYLEASDLLCETSKTLYANID